MLYTVVPSIPLTAPPTKGLRWLLAHKITTMGVDKAKNLVQTGGVLPQQWGKETDAIWAFVPTMVLGTIEASLPWLMTYVA